MFHLQDAWQAWDCFKQKIRNGEYIPFESQGVEPRMLLRCQAIDIQRRAKGIPSIFD